MSTLCWRTRKATQGIYVYQKIRVIELQEEFMLSPLSFQSIFCNTKHCYDKVLWNSSIVFDWKRLINLFLIGITSTCSLQLEGGTTTNLMLYPSENMYWHLKRKEMTFIPFLSQCNPPVHTLWSWPPPLPPPQNLSKIVIFTFYAKAITKAKQQIRLRWFFVVNDIIFSLLYLFQFHVSPLTWIFYIVHARNLSIIRF